MSEQYLYVLMRTDELNENEALAAYDNRKAADNQLNRIMYDAKTQTTFKANFVEQKMQSNQVFNSLVIHTGENGEHLIYWIERFWKNKDFI